MNSIKNWGGLPCSCTKIVGGQKICNVIKYKMKSYINKFFETPTMDQILNES